VVVDHQLDLAAQVPIGGSIRFRVAPEQSAPEQPAVEKPAGSPAIPPTKSE
jgi:allophanate hydrolase subunit 2